MGFSLGGAFKSLRESRHMSLAQATGGQFSRSMLSKFESGEHDISATKLLQALNNIHCSWDDFMSLAIPEEARQTDPTSPADETRQSGFADGPGSDDLAFLDKELNDLMGRLAMDKVPFALKEIYERESAIADQGVERAYFMLRAIVVKSVWVAYDDSVRLTDQEEELLSDYLFGIGFWTQMDYFILSHVSTLMPAARFTAYAKEMLEKSRYFHTEKTNHMAMVTALLNGYLRCIGQHDFPDAAFLRKRLGSLLDPGTDGYIQIVFLFAQGYELYARGKRADGERKMKQAILILRLLGDNQQAAYYLQSMKGIFQEEGYDSEDSAASDDADDADDTDEAADEMDEKATDADE